MSDTVTMKDVARYANVSKATVSRVLNNDPSVADALRNRVLKAVKELGYQRNRAARRLRASSSDVIGLVISDIQNPFFVSAIGGVEEMAYANQMSILLCNTGEDPARQEMYLRVMEAEQVAGLILVPAPKTDVKSLRRLTQAGMPVILLDRSVRGLDTDVVVVDNEGGAYDAVSHLIVLGYTRIAFLVGSLLVTTSPARLQGYRQALEAAGLPIDETLIKDGDSRREGGFKATLELMAMSNPPQAIFASNNLMTLGALQALREMNIAIPEQVALIGFDDMPWSGELCPPLTAVSQPTYELGREAVHLLLRRLGDPDAPFRTMTLQTQLTIRESCGVKLKRPKS